MLTQRIISSVILLSILFASIFMGYPYLNIYFAVIIAAMAWEWDKLISNKTTPFSVVYTALAMFCLFVPLFLDLQLRVPLALIAITALLLYFYAKKKQKSHPRLLAFGAIYIALPALALNIIGVANSPFGIIWVLAIAWACDTGGFCVGCTLKGPKLCPQISPKKTWSGFIGGLGLACLFSYLYTMALGVEWHGIYALTIALGIVAQIGDLLESSVKRYMQVKDMSNLIPGHGGVFDRMDSAILVVVVYAVLVVASDLGLINMMVF